MASDLSFVVALAKSRAQFILNRPTVNTDSFGRCAYDSR